LSFFSRKEEQQLRERLSETVRYIASQRLVNNVAGGRSLITEIMGSNLRSRETIRCGESENKTFHEIIEAASAFGWHTFDQSLLKAREANLVTDETVMLYCTNKGTMRSRLDVLQKGSGRRSAEVSSGLKLHIPEKIPVSADTA
jgi:twitching motility protein PilT